MVALKQMATIGNENGNEHKFRSCLIIFAVLRRAILRSTPSLQTCQPVVVAPPSETDVHMVSLTPR